MTQQILLIDFDDIRIIRNAEKRKTEFEDMGFKLIKTEQIGLNQFKQIWEMILK